MKNPLQKVFKYFSRKPNPWPPENSTRLDKQGQVGLYYGLIEEMGLKPGDMLMFVRNEAGRWEIWREEEIIEKIKTVWEDEE